jgi:hypothetical protein
MKSIMKKSGGLSAGTQIISFKEIIQGDGNWLIINDDNSKTIDYVASEDESVLHVLKSDDLPLTISFKKHSEISIGSQVLVFQRKDVEMTDDHDLVKDWWNNI